MSTVLELFREYHLLSAIWMTIKLAFFGSLGALVVGTIVAIMRVSPVGLLRAAGTIYVNAIRNTPLTLIAFFFCFALYIELGWSPWQSADFAGPLFFWGVVALSVYTGAFVAEAIRSGINTVPLGQAEAARALGLGFWPSLREVILPQAFRGAIAPLGNTLIALTKNTTVLATVGVVEISNAMKNMIEFSPQHLILIFLILAGVFVVLTLPLGLLFSWASKKWAVAR